MEHTVDLAVIGTGAAGSTIAHACRSAGWSVAVIDSLPYGGTCALRGCDPKKVLVGAAELADWSSRMQQTGAVNERLQIDWPALMRFKRTFTDPVPGQRERSFRDAGIQMLHGRARFLDRTRLSAGDDVVDAKHVAIAAGNKPVALHVPGEEHLVDSTQFLDLERLPDRIVFLGGGFISFEFAHVAARAGAKAHIVEREPRALAHFDAPLVERLVDATRDAGIEVSLDATVTSIERKDGAFVVHAQRDGSPCAFTADLVVHGGGRAADVDDMDLERAGVSRVKAGIEVNEYFQNPGNPAVYAAGDCAAGGGAPLTPVAGYEGEIAAENLLHGNRRKADFSGMAGAVYAIPPLAMAGLTEEAARAQQLDIEVKRGDASEWYSARRVNAKTAAYCVVTERGSGRILGAHILGFDAEAVVNVFSLAIRARLTAADLKAALFAYPTGASDIEYMLPG